MLIYNYQILTKKKLKLKKVLLARACQAVVRLLKIRKKLTVTLLVVDNQKIKELNKIYRHKNKVTDVLSFSATEGQKVRGKAEEGGGYLGEIFICYEQMLKQAKKYGHGPDEELTLLFVHGLLHLLGYDDQTDTANLKMMRVQNKILKIIYA